MNREQEKIVRELVKQDHIFLEVVNAVVRGQVHFDDAWPTYFGRVVDLCVKGAEDGTDTSAG